MPVTHVTEGSNPFVPVFIFRPFLYSFILPVRFINLYPVNINFSNHAFLNLDWLYDNGVILRISVKKGDVVKVSFAGSFKGPAYSGVWLTSGSATSLTASASGSSSCIQAWGSNWAPYHMVGFWKATADGTLTFQQGYFYSDLGSTSIKVSGRVAYAEIVNATQSY